MKSIINRADKGLLRGIIIMLSLITILIIGLSILTVNQQIEIDRLSDAVEFHNNVLMEHDDLLLLNNPNLDSLNTK